MWLKIKFDIRVAGDDWYGRKARATGRGDYSVSSSVLSTLIAVQDFTYHEEEYYQGISL